MKKQNYGKQALCPGGGKVHGSVLSLFAGAGGMDIGLEAAGLANVAYLECDRDCRATLEMNRPDWKPIDPSDAILAARSLTARDIGLGVGELDVIAAGPPCQPFSSAAQWSSTGRLGMADGRSATIHATVDIVRALQPRVVLIENVVGFMKSTSGAIDVLRSGLEEINREYKTRYALHHFIVDAADFGVPQHRRRAIVIARRDGLLLRPPEATHHGRPVRAWDAIGDLGEPDADPMPLGSWARDLLPSIPEGGNYQWLTAKGGGAELFGYRTRYWSFLLKLARDRPSWTLSASAGPSTGPFHWSNRQLTVRERLRLQSFPDAWQLKGSVRSQVRMAGNATPPLLAEVIGREIVRQVLNADGFGDTPLKLVGSRRAKVPTARAPIPIPRKFVALVGERPPHPGAGNGPSPRT